MTALTAKWLSPDRGLATLATSATPPLNAAETQVVAVSQPPCDTVATPGSVRVVSQPVAAALRHEIPSVSAPPSGMSQKSQVSQALPVEAEGFEERSALIAEGTGVPREWAEGFALLNLMPSPPDIPASRWAQIQNDAGRFLDQWGNQAAALGWRALDIFACPPHAPLARYDQMGLAMRLEGREVIAIADDRAVLRDSRGRHLNFARRTAPGAVVLWEEA